MAAKEYYPLYVNASNVIEFNGAKNSVTGAYLNAATVTAVIVDESDVQVAGASWPESLAYVPASDGVYRTTLDSLVLTEGSLYTLRLTVLGSGGEKDYREIDCQGVIRARV